MTKTNEELEQELTELRKEFKEYVNAKNTEEKQRLRTALLAAGGVILALGSFLWWEVIWPAITIGRQQ